MPKVTRSHLEGIMKHAFNESEDGFTLVEMLTVV